MCGSGSKRRWPVLAVALSAAMAAAGGNWKQKPPEDWTIEEAVEVLNDSPWARKETVLQTTGRLLAVFYDGVRETTAVYQDGPGQTPRIFSEIPARLEPESVEATYGVRWSSATATQEALARLREISPTLAEQQAPVAPTDEHYVLTVRVVKPPSESKMAELARETLRDERSGRLVRDRPPAVSDLLAGLNNDELQQRAELHVSNSTHLKPEKAERHGLGAGEGISFYFPRQADGRETIPQESSWAEFVFDSPKGIKLKVRFKFNEMKFNGRADW